MVIANDIQLLSSQSHWPVIPNALVPRHGALFALFCRLIFFRRVVVERVTPSAQREAKNKT